MELAGGIITILVIILPVFIDIWNKKQTVANRLKEENEKTDKAIATHDVDAVNRMLDTKLRDS